jgi:hypothetical protein
MDTSPSWNPASSSKEDYKVTPAVENRRLRYTNSKLGLQSSEPAEPPQQMDAKGSDSWIDRCPSVAGLTKDNIAARIEIGWRCSHWPACLRHNGNRAKSLECKPKRKTGNNSDVTSSSTLPVRTYSPFPDNS